MKLFRINLALFDGEGGAEGGVTAGLANQETSGEPKVIYGKQNAEPKSSPTPEDTRGTAPSSNTLEDKRMSFKNLIDGEYKDQFTEETQRIINRRFKETKNLESQVQNLQPIADMLMAKYKVDDLTKLQRAIENDDVYWSEAAEEAGMTVEQYKRFQKLERENKALLDAEKQRMTRSQVDSQVQDWIRQADEMKARFPNFNFQKEMENEKFADLVTNHRLPVEHAYKLMHFDELFNDAMTTTQVNTEKAVAANIRAKGNRPQENGTASQSAFITKDDVSKLTKEDRAEIARRVARGESISF